tara:strand:+ start:1150 stop:1527 length:378 start_codon:yes stop_codon:yes gene_type:complete
MARNRTFRSEIPVLDADIKIVGVGVDVNGNSIIRLKPTWGNQRGFSIQTNGNLPTVHAYRSQIGRTGLWMNDSNVHRRISKEIYDYIDKYGTKRQTKIALNRSTGGRRRFTPTYPDTARFDYRRR